MNKSIAIIGGGLVGLTTGLFLRRLNYDVSIFEKSPTIRSSGAGITLNVLSLFVLKQLDLLEKVNSLSTVITKIKGLNYKNKAIVDIDYCSWNTKSYCLGIHRANLIHLLSEEIRKDDGINIFYGQEITDIHKGEKTSIINKQNELLGQFDAAIISNGTHSSLYKKLNFNTIVKPYKWGTLWTTIPHNEPEPTNILPLI